MIVRNYDEHWIGCDICEEVTQLSRQIRANPETVLIMMEQLTRDHRPCEKHRHDPQKAKLHREFNRRIRKEMERALTRRQKDQRSTAMRLGEPR